MQKDDGVLAGGCMGPIPVRDIRTRGFLTGAGVYAWREMHKPAVTRKMLEAFEVENERGVGINNAHNLCRYTSDKQLTLKRVEHVPYTTPAVCAVRRQDPG